MSPWRSKTFRVMAMKETIILSINEIPQAHHTPTLTSSWFSFRTHRWAPSASSITTNPKPGQESMGGLLD